MDRGSRACWCAARAVTLCSRPANARGVPATKHRYNIGLDLPRPTSATSENDGETCIGGAQLIRHAIPSLSSMMASWVHNHAAPLLDPVTVSVTGVLALIMSCPLFGASTISAVNQGGPRLMAIGPAREG